MNISLRLLVLVPDFKYVWSFSVDELTKLPTEQLR